MSETPLHFRPDDPGPTGTVSLAKVSAVVALLASVLPLLAAFTDLLPVEIGLWDGLGAFLALSVIAAGLWAGLGRGLFRKFGDALSDRVADD